MDWTPRHVDFFVPPIPATDSTSGAEQGDVFPDNDVEQGPVENGPTADFEEGPVTPEPTDELQEGSVTPTSIDSSASDPFSSNATPQHHASDSPVFPYDPSAYDNLTINEVDAKFASYIVAKLKEQSVAFQKRQQVGRRNTVNDADDDMPALLPPEYPLCNDSIDSNTTSDADIVPPEEDHIASRVGRRHRQGNSLLSYAHHVASLVLPAQMAQRDELAVNLAESIDPIAAGDPGSDPAAFLP
jgi:hypothetical protein